MTALLSRREVSQFSAPLPVGTLTSGEPVFVSVIIPVYNEEKNIPLLMDQLFEVLATLGKPFEVVAVNDGSCDGSLARLREQVVRYPKLKVVDFRRNYGQTAAIMAGLDHTCGGRIISIGGRFQDEPPDNPN